MLLLMMVYPTLIAPLFNRFEPLADATLADRVQGLMDRCGFAARGLFVMDGSSRSAESNDLAPEKRSSWLMMKSETGATR
jgi:STE24 endopeptidase